MSYEKKVYCKNCKNISWLRIFRSFVRVCRMNKKLEIYTGWFGHKRIRYKYGFDEITEKNENNDCKDYKRKWWKIWK